MDVLIIRTKFDDKWTEGKLYIDGKYICDTLEDKDRELYDSMDEDEIMKRKVYGETCIPYGRYKLTIDYSNKFKKELIRINKVKGFDGTRIHSLNTADESLGCVGVGIKLKDGYITKSRDTYSIVHKIVQNALMNNENAYLTIQK